MVPDNGGCAPNVAVGVVFFTLITDLAVGTASNQPYECQNGSRTDYLARKIRELFTKLLRNTKRF